jgi:hypothetical protein
LIVYGSKFIFYIRKGILEGIDLRDFWDDRNLSFHPKISEALAFFSDVVARSVLFLLDLFRLRL